MTNALTIALAQLSQRMGDLAANADAMLNAGKDLGAVLQARTGRSRTGPTRGRNRRWWTGDAGRHDPAERRQAL